MAETALTKTTAPDKWSQTGVELVMTALDNGNGNKFVAASDDLLIVHNTTAGALTMTVTSQAIATGQGKGRTGNISISMAAGQYRVSFDARHLPSGVYHYRLEAGGAAETRAMLLVK